jgi:hypothetical protein
LLAERIAMGMNEGELRQNDITISFKIEQGEQNANGEAA